MPSSNQVFIESDALRLVLCHYVRSSPDSPEAGAEGGSRGGITRNTLYEIMSICLVADERFLSSFLGQVDALAALAESQQTEVLRSHSLVVSSSHMDVHALSAIFATYLSAWKGDKLWADPGREGKGLRNGEKVTHKPRPRPVAAWHALLTAPPLVTRGRSGKLPATSGSLCDSPSSPTQLSAPSRSAAPTELEPAA